VIASATSSPATGTPHAREAGSPDVPGPKSEGISIPRRLTPNPNSLLPAPKVLTKASVQAEAVARDNLRRDFLALQEAVRNTEILIPFVFYDGTNIPGGVVKAKKGDHIWLFLERCRKVGAQLGVSGGGSGGTSGGTKNKNDSRREWARVSVDDLMCVRGEVIIPHVSYCRPVLGLPLTKM
jgi:protein FAM50